MYILKYSKHRNIKVLQISPKVSWKRRVCSSNQTDFIVPERPDLPAWVKQSRNNDESKTDDDFAIPPFVDWARNSNRKTPRIPAATLPLDDNELRSNVVCEILVQRHSSRDDAVTALHDANIEASTDLIWQLLKRFRNNWVSAFAIFEWAKSRADSDHIPNMYAFMVDVLGYHKQFPQMWDLIREITQSEGHVSLTVMSKALRRLAKARMYDEAMQAFRSIETFGLARDIAALNFLMDAFVKEGSVEHAREAFDEFASTISPDSSTYNILIHGYCKVRKLDEARRIMQKSNEADVVAYTSLLEAYCAMKDFRKAEAIISEMGEMKCKPNVITYTILMHAYAKAKQMNDAVKVYARMKEEGIEADCGFYSAFIFMLCKIGRMEDAWEVFGNLGVRDLRIYNTMITALCKNWQEEGALKVLDRMREDKCKPEMSTYVPLLRMSCRMKTMKVFRFLMSHMFKNDVSLDYSGYGLVVDRLLKSGMVNHAAFFFCDMVAKGMVPRRATCSKMCEVLIGGHSGGSATRIDQVMRGGCDS